MSKQKCEGCPTCFGNLLYEEKDNDCENCAFYTPCKKVAHKVMVYDKMMIDLEKKGYVKNGAVFSRDMENENEKLRRKLRLYETATSYPRYE